MYEPNPDACPDCGKTPKHWIRTVCAACYHRRWKVGTHTEAPARKRLDLSLREERWCPRCQQNKPMDDFSRSGARSDGRAGWCRECYRASRQERVEHYREYERLKRYGITTAEYDALLEAQSGGCAICRSHCAQHGRVLSIDHDHATGKVRGLLCANCNRGIGLFQDDTHLLAQAIEYLRGG